MDTPDVMAARAALETAVAAASATDAPAVPVGTPPAPEAPTAPAPMMDAFVAEVEKQAVSLVKQEAPAVIAAVEAAISTPKTSWKKHLVSIAEQTVSTFAFSFLGLITATNLSDPTALKAAGVAGGIAVASYLKTVAGTYLATSAVA